ncbi:unnamed protein product [Adineta steineri]|uniref:Uncharacterized protein n=1 Tax=Adineta steineri TaxID=433720 RepID=A0A819PEQ2_9BILA|nr:unnamed protein product [Adineta steineri]CAF4012340.1 unnamed protein product [Adineta steineri]
MANSKTQCFKCNEEKITYPCKGCLKEFCLIHLTEHKQILNDELNHVANNCNEFKQIIIEQKQNLQTFPLIEQINQWKISSIEIIQQKAQECRKIAMEYLPTFFDNIEKKFNDLSEQIKQIHKDNEFNEINLNYLKNQLMTISHELNNRSNISIQQDSQAFINKISIIVPKKPKFSKWKQNTITVAGGNGQGQQLNQVNSPEGIVIDKNKNIFIADCNNHRIVEWKYNAKEGQIIAGGNGQGNRMDQLSWPTDVIVDEKNHSIIIADNGNRRVIQWMNQTQQILIKNIHCFGLVMDKYGYVYVSDHKKNEVRRWKMGEYNNEGIVVAGGNGKGDQLNQLNFPTFIFVDKDQSVYVSDRENNRVMKWKKDAKEGRIMAEGNGYGGNHNELYFVAGVIVDDFGQIYVADYLNFRVMRWCEEKDEGEIVVGGKGQGNQSNQMNGPVGLSFDDEGNLYVADIWNHRIEKFEIIL